MQSGGSSITPNRTEAALLSGLACSSADETLLYAQQVKNTILTSVHTETGIGYLARLDGGIRLVLRPFVELTLHGAGDVFTSALCGELLCGKAPMDALDSAADFCDRCIHETVKRQPWPLVRPGLRAGIERKSRMNDIITVKDLQLWYGQTQGTQGRVDGHPGKEHHGPHRPLRLRQIDVPQDARPHERSRAGRAHRGRGPIQWAGYLRPVRWTSTSCGAQIGMVFQKPNPFPMSIYDNIAYGPRTHGVRKKDELDEIVEQSLRGAAIWDEVKDRLKKSALGLSGGQQQRLCIARALAVQPQVLLMDEPTSALDPISTSKIEELATNLKEQYTIIIVTHNMQQALRISDKTAFFLLGELIEYDDTQKLFYQPKEKRTEDYITGRFG